MSIVKANRITGSSTALPEIDGLMIREAILATHTNQTRFSISMFDNKVNIRAFIENQEVEVAWEEGNSNNIATISNGVAIGTQIDFYGFGSRGITGTFWPSSDMGLVIENGLIVNVIQMTPDLQ